MDSASEPYCVHDFDGKNSWSDAIEYNNWKAAKHHSKPTYNYWATGSISLSAGASILAALAISFQ